MKKLILLTGLIALSFLAKSQCQDFLSGQSITWNNDASLDLYMEYLPSTTNIVWGAQNIFNPANPGDFLTANIPVSIGNYSSPNFNLYSTDFQFVCNQGFQIDENGLAHPLAIESVGPSACNGNDGQICYNVAGWSFTVDGIASVNGCVSGLSAGTHTFAFDPWLSPVDGMLHYNPSVTIDLEEFAIEFAINGDDLTSTITGGIGSFDVLITPNTDNDDIVDNYTAQCYTLEVHDNGTGCTAIITEYIPTTCIGDMNGDEIVNTQDLLLFMGTFYETGGEGDLNCDGTVNTADLLFFLTGFGFTC